MGFTNKISSGQVTEAHKAIAEGWHLSIADVRKAGGIFLSESEARRKYGCDTPMIDFVYPNINGEPTDITRGRLADPTKGPDGKDKPRKYTTKKDAGVALYVPRWERRKWAGIAKNPKKVIYITEGEAKALYAVLKRNLPFIAVQGNSGWQAKDIPAEQFKWFKWQGRRVIIIPDSDYRDNKQITTWFARLGAYLTSQGAKVSFRLLPLLAENFNKDDPKKSKTGIDDWFSITGNTVEDFKKLPTLPITDKYIQSWDAASNLPESMRNLKPVDPDWYDKSPPPVEPILPYLQKYEVAQFAGQAGTSKSTVAMYAAAAMATGTPFFQAPVDRCYRVLYCMLERHEKSFRRRWNKICHHIAADIEHLGPQNEFIKNLKSHFYPKPLAGQNMLLIEAKGRQWVMTPLVDALIVELKAAGIEIVIFDPLSRLHEGDEDGATMSALTKAFEYIAQRAGVSIIFVHHAGKDASAKGGKYAGRGPSQLTDNSSETVAFTEFKPSSRDDLPLDLSSLREGEEQDDIVRVLHTRCADGKLADPMYLVRSRETGLMRWLNVSPIVRSDDVDQYFLLNDKFKSWALGKIFTKNSLLKDRVAAGVIDVAEKKFGSSWKRVGES